MRAFDRIFLLLLSGCALQLNFAIAQHKTENDKTMMDGFGGQKEPDAVGAKIWLAVLLLGKSAKIDSHKYYFFSPFPGVIPLILIALFLVSNAGISSITF